MPLRKFKWFVLPPSFANTHRFKELFLPSATKLCFYTCVSVHGGGGVPGRVPPRRRLLLRTVRILLECIPVCVCGFRLFAAGCSGRHRRLGGSLLGGPQGKRLQNQDRRKVVSQQFLLVDLMQESSLSDGFFGHSTCCSYLLH